MINFVLIKPHLKKYKFDLWTYLIFAFLVWVISFVLPYLTGNYVDILVTANRDAVLWFTAIIFSLNAVNLLFKYISELALAKINTNIAFQISYALYERLKKVHLSYYHNLDSVYLVNRINNDANAIIGFFTKHSVSVVTQSLAMLLGLGILFYVNTVIALASIISIPIYILLYIKFKNKLYSSNYEFYEQRSQYFAKMTEQFSFIKFIKTHALFSVFAKRLKDTYNNLFAVLLKNFKVNYIFRNASELIIVALNAFAIFYGGMGVINGSTSIGQYTIINVYFNLIISALDYFLGLGSSYQEYLASNNRLKELSDIEMEGNGTEEMTDIQSITIQDLSFAYQKDTDNLLCDLNLKFQKGNIYSLVGENGTGKSTFISILLGLYNDLYKGHILYNGVDMKLLDMYDLRSRLIAVTEQEPVLFNASAYDNIFVVKKGEEYSLKLKEYCELLNIGDIVFRTQTASEPDDLKLNLSGGEKQKVSIIRSLMKNTPVLIFDEPTSALDKASTEQFKELMRNLKRDRIIILITHDDTVLDISDQTIDFNF